MAPRVITVTGPMPVDRIGMTLPHEHLSCSPDQLRSREHAIPFTPDAETMTDELRDARRRGVSCIVDVTPQGLGRDPEWLRALSSRTGVHVVMGTGWYRESFYPAGAAIQRRSADDLADEIVAEAERGVGESGVHPGIIGEIGTDRAWLSPAEERVHRAAARAARRTGLAVMTHARDSQVGLDQLAIFEEEGLDGARVVIGHADTLLDLDYYLAVTDRGASLSFDQLGRPGEQATAREAQLVKLILELLERGCADRILLSQDVCTDAQLKAFGGTGYGYVAQHFLPALRTAAVGEGEIGQMTVENPRRILAVA
jgi:predicted metal-dependent phosphotriesterase family hydrolase